MYFFKGTKEQLDTLTSDIKGNANVVRTKLKCESTHPDVIHSSCIFLQYNIKVSLQPWNKVCPEMMLSAEPQWTSGSRKLRSESALQKGNACVLCLTTETNPVGQIFAHWRAYACLCWLLLYANTFGFCFCLFSSTQFCPGSLLMSWRSTMRLKCPFGKEAKEGSSDNWRSVSDQ